MHVRSVVKFHFQADFPNSVGPHSAITYSSKNTLFWLRNVDGSLQFHFFFFLVRSPMFGQVPVLVKGSTVRLKVWCNLFFFVISFCESEKWRWLPNCLIMMAVGRWWKLRGKWAGWDFSRYIIRLNQATYEKNSQFASVHHKIPLKIRVYYYVEKELRKKTRKWNHYNDVLTCYFWTYLQSSSDVFQNIVR